MSVKLQNSPSGLNWTATLLTNANIPNSLHVTLIYPRASKFSIYVAQNTAPGAGLEGIYSITINDTGASLQWFHTYVNTSATYTAIAAVKNASSGAVIHTYFYNRYVIRGWHGIYEFT